MVIEMNLLYNKTPLILFIISGVFFIVILPDMKSKISFAFTFILMCVVRFFLKKDEWK